MTEREGQRLVLVRHAKSASPVGIDDHARPLDDRGRAEARRLGLRLADLGWRPDRVLCSDAVRALTTWERMAPAFAEEVPLVVTRRLYHAGFARVDEEVRESGDAARCLFVIGHNPGWEEVVYELTGAEVALATATAALMTPKRPAPWSAGLAARGWTLVARVDGADG